MGELGIAEDMTIVVYDGAGLFSAPRVWWMFTVFGARDVRILRGWLPGLDGGRAPGRSGRAAAAADPAVHRPAGRRPPSPTSTEVRRALDTARPRWSTPARPNGSAARRRSRGRALRSGHLPGSHNLPYGEVVRDGRLADPETIAAAVEAAGIDPDRPVITSCGSGVTAAILWLALDAIGHPPAALYDGSYTEWGGRDDVPVATGDR